MKKIMIFLTASILLASACSTKPKEYVVLGQLFSSFGHGSQEKVSGKVKEFKQTHFLAVEENGKIVKGRAYNAEDRRANPLGKDYIEEFNEAGVVTRSRTFDDNGMTTLDINVISEGKELKASEYVMNDVLRYKVFYLYENGKMTEAIARDPENDTIMMSTKYEYDQAGNITKTQSFNSKGEPQGYNTRESDANGLPVKTRSYSKDGKMTSLHDYVYNEKGERTGHHEENFNTGAVLDFTFRYEYDSMGNKSAIIFMRDDKPFIYRAREISYYK